MMIKEDTFIIHPSDLEEINKWISELPEIKSTAIGGRLTFSFTPTSIGTFIEVKDVTGKKLVLDNL